MSGPRVTTGADSKQDYATPTDFMEASAKAFKPVCFDLAAHAGNAKHARYFAPRQFITKGTRVEIAKQVFEPLDEHLHATGKKNKHGDALYEHRIDNDDPKTQAYDSLSQLWACEYERLGCVGPMWLNPPFDDIAPWAWKCKDEAALGAEILFLTPAATGSNWFRDLVAPHADVYLLNGRLSFDGKNPYPKDCILSHYRPETSNCSTTQRRGQLKNAIYTWDWKNGVIYNTWRMP